MGGSGLRKALPLTEILTETMRTYDPHFTEKMRNETLEWFEARMERLPQSLQINPATSTANLPRTVQSLMGILRANKPSVVLSGYMETLLQIRDRLEEQGFE